MVTDDERREVAQRLREVEGYAIPDRRIADHPITVEVIAAAVMYDLPDVKGMLGRLADLIEPSCDRDTPQKVAEDMFGKMRHSTKEEADAYEAMLKSKSVEIHSVDRDALLKLADEMERMPQCELCPAEIIDCSAHPDGCPDALLHYYARRIRDALDQGRR